MRGALVHSLSGFGAAFTPAALGSKILLWSEARALTDMASGSTAGSGTPASGGTAGFWQDKSPTADALVQATSGRRPVVRTHALGRGVAVDGTGGVGAGGAYLETGASRTGIKWAWVVATLIGPDTTRGGGASPSNLFADDYHGLLGTAPISASAVLATGFQGTNNLGQYSLASFARDGTVVAVASANVGHGRRRVVLRVEHTTSADAGKVNALRHVGFDGYYMRGSEHAVICASAAMTAQDVANVDSYLISYWLGGGAVVITGDSIGAGFGVTEAQGPAALLHETYNRCIPCPNIAVPGQGVGSSISPLVDTLLTTDAAKLAALKFTHSPAVLVVVCGTNDLANGRTAAQLLADVQTYAAARRAEGWRVVVCTVAPRTFDTDGVTPWPAGKETQRTTYNASLRSTWSSWADALVDLDAYAPALSDGIHLTVAGNATLAAAIRVATDSLLGAAIEDALLTEGGDTLTTEAGYRLTF